VFGKANLYVYPVESMKKCECSVFRKMKGYPAAGLWIDLVVNVNDCHLCRCGFAAATGAVASGFPDIAVTKTEQPAKRQVAADNGER